MMDGNVELYYKLMEVASSAMDRLNHAQQRIMKL